MSAIRPALIPAAKVTKVDLVNVGLRIRYLLLSPSLSPRLRAAGVDKEVRGWEKSSDHAPVWVEIG